MAAGERALALQRVRQAFAAQPELERLLALIDDSYAGASALRAALAE